MKKIIKLTLLLVVALSVNSRDVCTNTCAVQALEAKLKASHSSDLIVDENGWILNTRFKY